MRRFGILIDQVRFFFSRLHYCCAEVDLLFIYLIELPRDPQSRRHRRSSFGRIQKSCYTRHEITHNVKAVNFNPPMSSITVDSDAQNVAVNCGACVGTYLTEQH